MPSAYAAKIEQIAEDVSEVKAIVKEMNGRQRETEKVVAVNCSEISTLKTELNKRTILETLYTTVASVFAAVIAYFLRQGGNP